MEVINWKDTFFDDGDRIVLSPNELGVPGLAMFGKETYMKATSPLQLHFHENCFELIFVVKGTLSFYSEGHCSKFSGGDVFINFPDEIHGTASEPFTMHEIIWFQLDISNPCNFLFLESDWAKYIINNLYKIQHRVIKSEKIDYFVIKQCFSLFYNSYDINCIYQAVSLLVSFLHRLFVYDRQSQFKLTPDIGRAVDHILNNIAENLSLSDLAELGNLSLSHFKQKFKYEMGITPREFINQQKIEAAKEMLLEQRSVTDVAMDLGFSSSNYFSVVFKQFTMLSPTEFILKHLQKK